MRGPQQESLAQQQQTTTTTTTKSIIEQEVQQEQQPKDESRLARVKRVLLGRGSNAASGCNSGSSPRASFGIELELVERQGGSDVPRVVHRLCGYLEAHGFNNPSLFKLPAGSSRLADRLRLAFDRRGDADLEAAACPVTAALLLRQYLKELPRPIVGPTCVSKLLQLHARERGNDHEGWIDKTRDLLANELPIWELKLLGYLIVFLGKFEARHGCGAGVCGIFAPILLPHVPPATVLLRDILHDAPLIFPDAGSQRVKESTLNGSQDKATKDQGDSANNKHHHHQSSVPSAVGILGMGATLLLSKPSKRKDRRDSCGQERKLIRSNSEEKIVAGESCSEKSADTIRRVSSHEDFNSAKHHHILSKLQKDMGGHGPCLGSSQPLHERTSNVSPASSRASLMHSTGDVVLATEKYDCDAERLRNSERFSRSITPRGRRQARRKKLHLGVNFEQNSSRESNEITDSESIFNLAPDFNKSGQSFLEMLSGDPSRSPSPVRPPSLELDDANNPTIANWSFPIRQSNDEEMDERLEAMVSPRNSILIPRRFYNKEDEVEDQENIGSAKEYGLKSMMRHINSLKRKIKKYEGEFEDNFGYRPTHSDKMSNRDIKRIVSELSKVRKEHKILKEGFVGTLLSSPRMSRDEGVCPNNNNNGEDKLRATTMAEMVKEVDRKLSEKRIKYNRSENMEDLTYEQLLDEKTAVQKALLHIENTFGRPVSKEDRSIVRPLYDKYRTLKRLLIRAGANRYNDSMSELATILEHEAMDFTSAIDCDRRASEPDMSHRGILDCIDFMDQVPTDSDSQHSSSEGSRGVVESLHSLPKDELLQQQRVTKEEKKRLRRALKELEMQFEVRVGRRMQREDRGPQVHAIYDSYKQTKAKLRLISALLAKNA
ncbi:uncharacterized protein LOC106640818 [Copidosoma floridanum]|uniref:uncharacterized protein LOC106640818 n=1 Tax=Copidosoma floridanum TaxID=29053 RepID=UPI0006C93ED2|nr:uncharacterized protein LOC106640818 [Copidosoma floridanum]XP_014210465.1 uncharacterized protein LOC106640818 [Copidosoma floridanum]